MSDENGENLEQGEKRITKSEEDKKIERIFDNEIVATDCIDDVLPDAKAELCSDEWAYDVFIERDFVGTVYLVDPHTHEPLTVDEICEQVQKLKKKVDGNE